MFEFAIIFTSLIIITTQICDNKTCNCVNNSCDSCLATFAFIYGQSCIICPIECQTCQDAIKCLTCSPSYYLVNESCLLCPKNCLICNPTCIQCADGFALQNNICLPCQQSYALTCSSPTTVLTCQSGYWQNGNSCSPCRQFCLICSSPSNCLQCQSGFQVLTSFGSYCSSCGQGCSSCLSSTCTSCFYNYQLINGICNDISKKCTDIRFCSSCVYSNGQVMCQSCSYPYYLNNSQCILGSSLLCQNGSVGPMYYDCLNSCPSISYQISTHGSGIICLPYPWISNINQIYFNSYSQLFSSMTYQTDYQMVVYNNQNSLSFNISPSPYYKLQMYFKLIAVGLIDHNFTLNFTLRDNLSNTEYFPFLAIPQSNYQPLYYNFTTKVVKEELITIDIMSQAQSNVIVGLSELLVQIYPCSANCRLCYNREICMQCFLEYFVSPDGTCIESCGQYIQLYLPNGNPQNYSSKSCVMYCPEKFYAYSNVKGNGTYFCLACSGLCMTCISDVECLTCISPYIYYEINYTCLVQCPNTHYQLNGECQPCQAPCATCSNQSICLTCSMGFFINGKCSSSCPTATYQDSFSNLCSPCNQNCTSCMISPNYCLSCQPSFLLYQSACVQVCISTLYFVNNGVCQLCLSPCKQCYNQNQCISCTLGILFGKQCVSICPDRYFPNSFDSTCLACQNGCLTCLSQIMCLTCPNSTNLYSYACYSNCPINTYSDNGVCLDCLLPCLNCVNQLFCSSCSIGYLSQVSVGQCLSDCEPGYYNFELNSTCLKCTDNCNTCSTASYICLSCTTQFVFQNSACTLQCMDGYFNLSGICTPCTYPCFTCAENDYTCTSCYNSYILLNSSCQTQCPSLSFLTNNSCKACQLPCSTCTSISTCLTCASVLGNQTYLFGSLCIYSCPSLTYGDDQLFICRDCQYPCSNCISDSICLSCVSGYLNPLTGSCQLCPENMFGNDTSLQCEYCYNALTSCSICSSSSQCTQCKVGYYLYQNQCISHSDCSSLSSYYIDVIFQSCSACQSPCKSCMNDTYCLSCLTGHLLEGSCLIQCPIYFYQMNQTCLACRPPCLTCSNLSKCLTCTGTNPQNIYFSVNYSCIQASECPSGYYIAGFQCAKCSIICTSCMNSSFCLGCTSGILIGGACKSACPNGYFVTQSSNSQICSLCSSNCNKCSFSANYCTSCQPALYLSNNICVSSCGYGFYLDQSVLQCFSCLLPCGNCSSLSYCVDCIDNTFILYFGQCIQSCPKGYYDYNQTCTSCPNTCSTCQQNLTNIVCLTCASGLYMSSIQKGFCVSSCSYNEYGDTITSNCYECINPCLSCLNAINCLSCINGYLLYKNQCLKIAQCPSGSFLLSKTCVFDCGSLWAKQSTGQCVTQCISPSLKLIANELRCIENCPQNYAVVNNYTCDSCSSNNCDNLLQLTIQTKNIFNVLFVKITISQSINLEALTSNMLTITLSFTNSRLLTSQEIRFQIAQININAVWLSLSINESLNNCPLLITFQDYYLFNYPLQSLSYGVIVSSYDYYDESIIEKGATYQQYAQIMSIIMLIIFAINVMLNSGHLSYAIIDFYQLLFMVLFLSIDYPPQLNHFLYGFRYSHYMFIPQIFRGNSQSQYTTSTPGQFGVIVPDVDFIKNTGHDFIIISFTFGTLFICKLLQMIFQKYQNCRSNKVGIEEQAYQKQEKENCFIIIIKSIISRFKWNYFNDIIYSIYFSIMLFAFSQLYDLQSSNQQINLFSIIAAFFFLAAGLILPFLLGYMLRKNEANLIERSLMRQKKQLTKKTSQNKIHRESNQNLVSQKHSQQSNTLDKQQQKGEYEILTDYKCFLSGVKLKVRLGFYSVPIAYFRKLILAALLVYFSEYPSLVLGIIMMLCFINILISIVLRPHRLTFQQILCPIFEGLYLIIFLIICIMQLPQLNLTQQQKLNASMVAIVISIILSILLSIHSLIMNIIEIIKYFWKINYLSKYYETEYVNTEQSNITEIIEPESNGTNVPLKRQVLEQQSNHETGSEIFSGLDIYLKKESNAPQFLIKCVKLQVQKSQHNNQAIDRGQNEIASQIQQETDQIKNTQIIKQAIQNLEAISLEDEQIE